VRNLWNRVVPRKISPDTIPGEYVAKTSLGRKIYCYGNDSTEAFNNSAIGLKDREYILSIGRNVK
jgi:hypothetical protein